MILEIENLKKNYKQGSNTLTVLDELNLKVEGAKKIAIVGKSGSGKSTLLSLIAGLDKPTSGEIKLKGESIIKMSEDKLAIYRADHMSIVFQGFHLMSTLTALENVMLPLEILRRSDAKKRADDLLEKVGLSHRVHHFPQELSGGENQRVAIARALASSPSILLADEPSGNLDTETGAKVMQMLFDLSTETGTTLLLVTHDDELALRCDEIYRLENHKLVRQK